jgi:hypothetical protein
LIRLIRWPGGQPGSGGIACVENIVRGARNPSNDSFDTTAGVALTGARARRPRGRWITMGAKASGTMSASTKTCQTIVPTIANAA